MTQPRTTRPRSSYLRKGTVALVVLAVIAFLINLLLLQRHTGATADGQQLAQRISQGIQSKTKATSPPQVWCPASIPKADSRFSCKLQQGGEWVAVAVTRAGGTFTWSQTTEAVAPPP